MPARIPLDGPALPWSEARVGAALAHQLFNGRSVLVVPCCGWTGHECDLLVVCKDLRIVDVEIKISRADLKADLKKDKWWQRGGWNPAARKHMQGARREWPPKVWKHYYALPKAIWDDKLLAHIPASSGVLLLQDEPLMKSGVLVSVKRLAKPNRDAKAIAPGDAIDIARLASLRMWDAKLKALS